MKNKLTKIVATISDQRCETDFLAGLYERGMNVVRINTAHVTPESALKVVENTRQVSEKIPILLDTKGPEIRITEVKESFEVKKGEKIAFRGDCERKSSGKAICVSYVDFVHDVPIGSHILIDDGEVEFEVLDKNSEELICEIKNDGTIKSRKSINIPGVHLNLPSISSKDRRFIDFAIAHDLEFIAHSFVRNKGDVLAIQEILDQYDSEIKIIAKIENQFGVDNIDEILDHAYGIMVARGDLGIEIPAERIPGVQRMLVDKCILRKKPVIIATQMLHTMIENPRPTRAEVNDIATAIYSETDAIMLSGETAYGKYAFQAVETMRKIALEVESSREVRNNFQIVSIDNQIAVFLAESAVKACAELPVKAIILDTLSGRTARYMAAFRGEKLVHVIAYSQRVMRELALSYGVYAEVFPRRRLTEEFKQDAVSFFHNKKCVSQDDLVLLIGGSFGARNGASFLEINTVKNLMSARKF